VMLLQKRAIYRRVRCDGQVAKMALFFDVIQSEI